jgi:hypothetical protein
VLDFKSHKRVSSYAFDINLRTYVMAWKRSPPQWARNLAPADLDGKGVAPASPLKDLAA